MRLTVEEDRHQTILRIEGRLVGPWTSELESTWSGIDLGSRKLILDISGMLFVDQSGKRVLKDILARTNCEIRANSPLTRDFADQISRPQ